MIKSLAKTALPVYAVAMREFRKRIGWPQPRLALELEVTRVTIARQETGVYEPRKDELLALVDLCAKRNQLDIRDALLEYIREREKERERKADDARALEYFERTQLEAEEGDETSQQLLKLSQFPTEAFAKMHLGWMNKARRTLKGTNFAEAFYRICEQSHRIAQLQRARQLRALRRIDVLREQAERLAATQQRSMKFQAVQNKELYRIIAEAKARLKQDKDINLSLFVKEIGDVIDKGAGWSEQEKRVTKAIVTNAIKLEIIWGIFAAAASREREGEPIDPIGVMDALEEAFKVGSLREGREK